MNAAAVLAAAIVDFMHRKIPNAHVAVMAVCGVLYVLLHNFDQAFMHVLSAVYVSAVVIILFLRKVLGGGDAKMLAALALWFTPQQLPLIAVATLIFGGILGSLYLSVVVLTLAGDKYLPNLDLPKIHPKAGMPYGVATAFGFAYAAWRIIL